MSKREIQHESVRTNRMGAINPGDRVSLSSIYSYENPPATYQPNDLITYNWAVQQLSGLIKKYDTNVVYSKNEQVVYSINDNVYQFYSRVDNNTQEPKLPSLSTDWSDLFINYIGAWNMGATYSVDDGVSSGGNMYRKKTSSFASGGDIDPATDSTFQYWEFIGTNRGIYNSATTYSIGDAVYTSSNFVYLALKSGILSNPGTGESTWALITPQTTPKTVYGTYTW